jgi:hypothetical protein
MNSRVVFASRMSKNGLTPPEYIIANKKLHTCHVEGQPPGSENGYYIFSASKPAVGLYGCFEMNLTKIWKSDEYKKMERKRNTVSLKKVEAMRVERKKAKAQYEAQKGGKAPEESSTESKSLVEVATSASSFDIEKYVKLRKEKKIGDRQIIYELMKNYGKSGKYSELNQIKLSALAIGMAVFPGQAYNTKKEKDALEAKVWRKVREYAAK